MFLSLALLFMLGMSISNWSFLGSDSQQPITDKPVRGPDGKDLPEWVERIRNQYLRLQNDPKLFDPQALVTFLKEVAVKRRHVWATWIINAAAQHHNHAQDIIHSFWRNWMIDTSDPRIMEFRLACDREHQQIGATSNINGPRSHYHELVGRASACRLGMSLALNLREQPYGDLQAAIDEIKSQMAAHAFRVARQTADDELEAARWSRSLAAQHARNDEARAASLQAEQRRERQAAEQRAARKAAEQQERIESL